MRRSNRSGFSLVELILAAALFTMLLTTVSVTMMNTFKASRRVEASDSVKNEGELVIKMIAREIEYSDKVEDECLTPDYGSDSLTLQAINADGKTTTPVEYVLHGPTSTAPGYITRKFGGATPVTISSANVSFYNYLGDCPMAFKCDSDKRVVTVCLGADRWDLGASDLSDTASGSGGLKFYRQVVRKN